MPPWKVIAKEISIATNQTFICHQKHTVSGGCINASYVMESQSGQKYFVKLNDASKSYMFKAEMDGLNEIINSQTIRAPHPICCGEEGNHAFLVLEYIHVGRSGNPELLGQQLAALHKTEASYYGWFQNNTIGSTPQINYQQVTWNQFWKENRLGYQLELAARQGYRGNLQKRGEQLITRLDQFFTGYKPGSTILHGDLWSGNYGFDKQGQPFIFDPAVYYGDRETDLAMTELFGGFPPLFYKAYNEAYPLSDGYPDRKTLYNLYHILNHLNLFGPSYLSQAEHMVDELLSTLG